MSLVLCDETLLLLNKMTPLTTGHKIRSVVSIYTLWLGTFAFTIDHRGYTTEPSSRQAYTLLSSRFLFFLTQTSLSLNTNFFFF